MSPRDKAKIVGGFDVYKAAQRAADQGVKADPEKARKAAPPKVRKKEDEAQPHIGRTAMPTRIEIACHLCGFEFKVTGRVENTSCPKCKKLIELTDHTIDGDWTTSIQTGGKIHITPSGVTKFGTLSATDIFLEGEAKSGKLRAHRLLILGAGARFDEEVLDVRDVKINAEADISFRKKVTFRNVDVHGTLNARIEASGVVTVHPGALLKGTIRAQGLVIEEGGGLKARMKVVPAEPEEVIGDD